MGEAPKSPSRYFLGAARARLEEKYKKGDDTAAAAAARDMDRLYEENLRKTSLPERHREYYRQREEYLQSTLMEGLDVPNRPRSWFRRRKNTRRSSRRRNGQEAPGNAR